MNLQEAMVAWRADQAFLAERGVHLPDVIGYIPDGFRNNYQLAMDSADEIRMAMDAQPTLPTAPNPRVPFQFTNFIHPKVFTILFSPTQPPPTLAYRTTPTCPATTAIPPLSTPT